MDVNKLPPLKVEIKRAVSNGQVYEVLSYDDYSKCADNYSERTDIGIILDREDGKNMILPLRNEENTNPLSPGVYRAPGSPILHIKEPDQASVHKYIPDTIVSINNMYDIKQIIESGEEVRRLDEPFITTPDEITKIPIRPDDQPEMVCLKTAINEKNIDIDKYANRFSSNFPNDKRQLKNTSVTLNIIKRFCDNMDMEALLTLRDKDENVPNPIGREITVSLTELFSGNSNDEE